MIARVIKLSALATVCMARRAYGTPTSPVLSSCQHKATLLAALYVDKNSTTFDLL